MLSLSSLITILSIYYLITTLEVKTEFKKESSDKKKYVNLILEFNINSDKDYSYWIIIDY